MTNAHATQNKMQERKQKLIIRKTYAETQEQKFQLNYSLVTKQYNG